MIISDNNINNYTMQVKFVYYMYVALSYKSMVTKFDSRHCYIYASVYFSIGHGLSV